MMRAMTQWQERSALEEYIYSHLQLRPVDFLQRDFRTELEIERMGMTELALDASTPGERTALFDSLRKGHHYGSLLRKMTGPSLCAVEAHPSGVVLPGIEWEGTLRMSSVRFRTFMGCTHMNALNAVKTLSGFFEERTAGIEASFANEGFMDRFLAPWDNQETPTIRNRNQSASCSIVPGYRRESRVMVPLAKRGLDRFVVYPFKDKAPLYNLARLLDDQQSSAVVEWNRILLLTDSLEIAWRNDAFCKQISQRGLLWSSWHGGRGRINTVDWSPLKGKSVYYVVLDHSGYTADGACQVALQVGEAIRTELGMELTYLICLERITGIRGLRRVPVALNAVEFAAFANRTRAEFSAGANITRQAALCLPTADFQVKRAKVFHPFIHERTTTLLYGRAGVGKSWLAIGIAASAASGRTLFGNWQAECPTDVVYICADSVANPAIEKLRALLGECELSPAGGGDSPAALQASFSHRGACPTTLTILSLDDSAIASTAAAILFWPSAIGSYAPSLRRPGRLVILDGFSSLASLGKASQSVRGIRNCLNGMLLGGGEVVVVASSEGLTGNEVQTMKRRIPFDSIVRVEQRRTPDASSLAISIHIEKGFAIPKGQRQSINVELDPISGAWNLKQSSGGVLGELKLVAKCMGTGKTDREIAVEVGISLELVKKRKRQLNGKEALPASIGKNRREFDAAMQLINRILKPTGLPNVPPPSLRPKIIR